MKTILLVLILLLGADTSNAQLRLVSYNLLNFPTGNVSGRTDTLKNIMEYARPHLLMIQELKDEDGLASITDMMNDLGYGDFAHSEFLPQQSPGSPLNLLQQAIVYDTEFLRMKHEGVVLTDYRDINEYILYLNDPLLGITGDTTFLYVYVTHLKSSTGTENEQSRLSMVNSLITHFEELPSDAHVIFAGDFNLYSNEEPAYQAITSEENNIVLKDVFASYGDWIGAGFSHKEILTQSTRLAQIFEDGAGGGVDDRFDFILFSESLLNPDNELHYIDGSFLSIGNNGMCYNQSITDCALGNSVPFDVLQSIYYMSDHIPQYCELASPLINNVESNTKIGASIIATQGNLIQDELHFRLQGFTSKTTVRIAEISGRTVQENMIYPTQNDEVLQTQHIHAGMYIVSAMDDALHYATEKIIIIR